MKAVYEDIPSLSYEQAFAELEKIINGLEANQKSLEESIALFERGQSLAQHCAALLEQAELRVRQLNDQDLIDSPTGEID
jgi:exodeoxyribonuclease VII small subunit